MDEIERRLRNANALPIRRNSPLSARAESDLTAILSDGAASPTASTRRQRRQWPIWATAAAAALAVLAVVLFPQPPASMASPPALKPTPIDLSLQQLATQLGTRARAMPAPPAGVVDFHAWSASVEADRDNPPVFVQPTVVERRYSLDDKSGTVRVLAGDVAYGTPTQEQPALPTGELIEEYTYAAGDYPLLYTEPLPPEPDRVPDYFERTAGQPLDSAAGDYFKLIQDYGTEHMIQGDDAATFLEFLATLDDVAVLGEVTDRLNRPGIAITTKSRAGGTFQDVLIFSPDDGRLLSAEETYLGGLEGFDIDYPTVFNYIAWKDPT